MSEERPKKLKKYEAASPPKRYIQLDAKTLHLLFEKKRLSFLRRNKHEFTRAIRNKHEFLVYILYQF